MRILVSFQARACHTSTSRHLSTSTAPGPWTLAIHDGPSETRSAIFSIPPPDPSHPHRTLRRRRILAQVHVANLDGGEQAERAKRRFDPWRQPVIPPFLYLPLHTEQDSLDRMTNSPNRQCIVTRQLLPSSEYSPQNRLGFSLATAFLSPYLRQSDIPPSSALLSSSPHAAISGHVHPC